MIGMDDVEVLRTAFASFSLESNFAARFTDKYVSPESVNAMCQTVLKKLDMLLAYRQNSDVVETAMAAIFTSVVTTFKDPYTKAIDAFKEKIDDLKDKIDTLKDELNASKDALNASKDHLNASKDDLNASKDDLNASKDNINTLNREMATLYQSKIALMEAHEKEKYKIQAEANANLLKMQVQAKESAVPGSVTNAEVWEMVKAQKGFHENVPLPPLPTEFQISDAEIKSFFPGPYNNEPDLYPSVLRCLRNYLDSPRSEMVAGAKAWATHSIKSGFRGRRPDFTITIDGVASADPSSVIAPFEVKHGNAMDKDFGQLYGYMKQVTQKQPRRRVFVGILYSPAGTFVLTVTRNKQDWAYDLSPKVTLAEAIGHLKYIVIPGEGYSPGFPIFSLDLGNVLTRLGNPAFCAVATFQPPGRFEDPPSGTRWVDSSALSDANRTEQVFVVKRTMVSNGPKQPARPVRGEIKILRQIHQLREIYKDSENAKERSYRYLPQLIFHSLDFQELGILPYGAAIDPGNSIFKWSRILTDVLSALEWLHTHGIVHRDVRWDNVIYHEDRAILIDLGAAVFLDSGIDDDDDDSESVIQPTETSGTEDDMPSTGWQFYAGGLICCPERVIGNFLDLYTPQPADDCRSFVQMTNTLLWPKFWEGLRSEQVKDKDSRLSVGLVKFWEDLRRSRIWGRYVKAADEASYTVLAEIVELCVYLDA